MLRKAFIFIKTRHSRHHAVINCHTAIVHARMMSAWGPVQRPGPFVNYAARGMSLLETSSFE